MPSPRSLDGHRIVVFRFFFQAEDGIRDRNVTGVQTCALPIFGENHSISPFSIAIGKMPSRYPWSRISGSIIFPSQVLLHSRMPTAQSQCDSLALRSEERRVGKECRSRRAAADEKINEEEDRMR